MKLLFDENLSYRVVNQLRTDFPEILHADQAGLPDQPGDTVIFRWAKENGYVLVVTQDSDFIDILEREGPPPKIILLRVGNQRNATWVNFFRKNKSIIEDFAQDEKEVIFDVVALK